MLSCTSDFVDRGACLQGLLDRSWEAEKGNRVKKHCDFEVSRECAYLPGSKCTCWDKPNLVSGTSCAIEPSSLGAGARVDIKQTLSQLCLESVTVSSKEDVMSPPKDPFQIFTQNSVVPVCFFRHEPLRTVFGLEEFAHAGMSRIFLHLWGKYFPHASDD